MMNKWTKKALVTMAVAVPLSSGIAFADTTTSVAGSAFDAAYQQKASTEAGLLQQAQASTVTSADITALSNTVTTINAQITALYQVEQALVAARSTIPVLSLSDQKRLHDLTAERLKLLQQSNQLWSTVQKYKRHQHNKHDKALFQKALGDHNKIQKELNDVNGQLSKVEGEGEWRNHPYAGGLETLQSTILKLEDSAIHYTNEWIALESQDGTTTGSVYGSSDGASNSTVTLNGSTTGTGTPNGTN